MSEQIVEVDARIDAACAELGIEALPWQRAYLRAVMRGERLALVRGRRIGFTTLQQITERVDPGVPYGEIHERKEAER